MISKCKNGIRNLQNDTEKKAFFETLSSEAEDYGFSELKHAFEGLMLIYEKKYDEAHHELSLAIQMDETNFIAWDGIGIIRYYQNEFHKALEAFEQVIQLDPKWERGWNSKGDALHALERYEEALTAFDAAIRIDSNNPGYFNNKGNALYDLERYEEALTAFDAAIRIDSNNPGYFNNKGNALYDLERYEEALTAFDAAIRIDSNNPGYFNNKGNALYDLERYEEALTAFDAAIRIDSNNPGYFNNKGDALYDLERYEEALTAYDAAIRIDSNNPGYFYNKGTALVHLERYEEALTAYDAAIRIDSNDASYFNNKGTALGHLERYEEALTAYDAAIRIDSNGASYFYNKGNDLGHLERYEEALMAYDAAIRIDSNNPGYFNNKGTALGHLERYEEALTAYDAAIRIDSNDASYFYNKGNDLGHLERYEEALMAYDAAIRIDSNDASYFNNKGTALGHLERYEEALTAYDAAIRIDSNDASYFNNKGNALRHLERYEEALTAYDAAIRIEPGLALPWAGKYFTFRKIDKGQDAYRAIKHFCLLAEGKDLLERASILLSSLYYDHHATFLFLRLTEAMPGLFLSSGWLDAIHTFQERYAVPLTCAVRLASEDKTLRQIQLRTAGCLFYHMGDSIVAIRDYFDTLDDEFHDDLLGQYYIALSLWDYFEDYSAALQDAVEAAEAYTGNDPEQLYYAARIFFFAERDEEALRILDSTGDYVPALLFLFESAADKGDNKLMVQLAERILATESAAQPHRRFLQYDPNFTFDLLGTDWMYDVLHWAHQCELVPQIHAFLETLESKRYYTLRAQYSDALQETFTGPMDIATAWELDEKSKQYLHRVFDEARESFLGTLRADLMAVHHIDITRYDNVPDELLEKILAKSLENKTVTGKAAFLLISCLYHEKRLNLQASFVLEAYAEFFNKQYHGFEAMKEAFFSGLINASAAFGSSALVVSALQRVYPLDPLLVMCIGAGLPSAITTFVITMTRNRPKRDMDYPTFKDQLREHIGKQCPEIPIDFWDGAE